MGFDLKKFMNASFEARTKDIEVPELKSFFDEGERPLIRIRGLTGEEWARVSDTVANYRNIERLVEGILSTKGTEKVEAVKGAFGMGDKVPDDLVRRYQLLVYGSVEPKLDEEAVKKISRCFPIDFYHLTNEVITLSGQGGVELGKSQPSGMTPESEGQCASAETA